MFPGNNLSMSLFTDVEREGETGTEDTCGGVGSSWMSDRVEVDPMREVDPTWSERVGAAFQRGDGNLCSSGLCHHN